MASVLPLHNDTRVRPAAPFPHNRKLSTLGVLREMSRNPVAAFGTGAYTLPYAYARTWVQDFLMVNDPEGVKHVLLDNWSNYAKSIQFQRLTRPALGNGLVNAEGASWRFQRRVAAPMFQPRHLAAFAPVMTEAADETLAAWSALPDGSEIDAAEAMMHLTYEIISRTLFSRGVAMNFGKMASALALYLETQGRVSVLRTIGLPSWIPTWDDLRARAPLAYFRKELSQLVAARRRQLDASPADAPHDFLTLLLSTRDPEGGALFGEAEVFDNVMTFVFAGHETTANALAWTLYLLALHPQWDVRLAEEVHNESEVERLVLTRMVLEESLRLYPPAPIISRDSIGPDTVGGIEIRANTSVMISPWVLHRHRLLWNEPDYFDPDRFGPGRRESIHRFAYLPFGAGPRVCIGMGFSLQEATIILSAILRQFRLELLPGQAIEPQARLTLRPRHGIRMRVHRR